MENIFRKNISGFKYENKEEQEKHISMMKSYGWMDKGIRNTISEGEHILYCEFELIR